VYRGILGKVAIVASLLGKAYAQGEFTPLNFNIAGGVGFPLSDASHFVNNGANFVVGAGPNFSRLFGMNGEFMWHDLPVKRSTMDQLGIASASAREYSVTLNAIVRIPTPGLAGAYLIGGGGWYHRSGEAIAPVFVPGTVCPGFWSWWGACVNGLWPARAVVGSTSSDAFGGNIGGGFTIEIIGNLKFYTEIRYHHASHRTVTTDILPLTFGLRW